MSNPLSAGLEAVQAGDFARAVPLLAEAARANPNDYRARMALGAALGELGRWDDAIAVLREAVTVAPGIAATHCNLGVALEKSGHFDEARQAYQFALRIDPDNPHAAAALQRPMEAAAPAAVAAAPAAAVGSSPAVPSMQPAAVAAAPAAAAAPPVESAAAWPASDGAAGDTASSYEDLWATATTAGGAPPPAAGPRAPAAGSPAGGGIAAPPGDAEDDAAARGRALRERIQREVPAKVEAPPLMEQVVARLRPLIRPLIYGAAAIALCLLAYGVYYEALGPGKVARETLASGEQGVTEGYQAIKNGLEKPDAALLARYAPAGSDQAPTADEVSDRNARLRSRAMRCTVRVLRVTLDPSSSAESPKVRAAIALSISGTGASVMSQGEQVWEKVQDRWLPAPDPKNWKVFGKAQSAMRK